MLPSQIAREIRRGMTEAALPRFIDIPAVRGCRQKLKVSRFGVRTRFPHSIRSRHVPDVGVTLGGSEMVFLLYAWGRTESRCCRATFMS